MGLIFHITTRSQWQQAQQTGVYRMSTLDTEGFIHCSTASQVVWVANQFFQGQTGLVLLGIDPTRLQSRLQYDEVEGRDRFPHLYGPLNLEAVVQVLVFEPGVEGQFELPIAIALDHR